MSTLQGTQESWAITGERLDSKYEKCLNITQEIYKRINITFQIKKLEAQSDLSNYSDQIDSNDLSNGTDLFACDKTSISSSTDAERPQASCEKYININNNEETNKKPVIAQRRPRKRFRKRVKKRQSRPHQIDTDGSSDEAPLSRIVETDMSIKANQVDSPHNVMGVPNIVIVASLKPKLYTPEKKHNKRETTDNAQCTDTKTSTIETKAEDHREVNIKNENIMEMKNCSLCGLLFRGERGLRRHMSMSHILTPSQEIRRTR
ncbi:uncharacterized protein LOC114246629 [Bombyx mandarina]|uniref:Uncharacterized protein LOC114246629 n=1 Tax=Bombyx mandarina TaxID=7092 RepID=A0A6J2K234_BOMMA|nr:uncharacterized protein LOC114246629 [Bombyx mandarina]